MTLVSQKETRRSMGLITLALYSLPPCFFFNSFLLIINLSDR
ncbi:hypothetical protein [Nostoc sp.]